MAMYADASCKGQRAAYRSTPTPTAKVRSIPAAAKAKLMKMQRGIAGQP